jgi:hypothetical protein
MRALRSALIAVLATVLLAGLGLVLAQVPDCTTSPCVYLPLIVKPFPTATPPTPPAPTAVVATDTPESGPSATDVPTLAPVETDTPVVATLTPVPTNGPQPTALP